MAFWQTLILDKEPNPETVLLNGSILTSPPTGLLDPHSVGFLPYSVAPTSTNMCASLLLGKSIFMKSNMPCTGKLRGRMIFV